MKQNAQSALEFSDKAGQSARGTKINAIDPPAKKDLTV